jgi:hypothetical protein
MKRNMTLLAAFAGLALASTPLCAAELAGGFSVDVSLSANAAAKLAALKEKIVVAAYFSGEPAADARQHADEEGQINLGAERVTISGAGGRAEVTGKKLKTMHLAWVKDRDAQVVVNVFSARLSGPNNLLNCDFYESSLAKAHEKPIAIACKLIGEG